MDSTCQPFACVCVKRDSTLIDLHEDTKGVQNTLGNKMRAFGWSTMSIGRPLFAILIDCHNDWPMCEYLLFTCVACAIGPSVKKLMAKLIFPS
jgi:hypothetical protein